MSFTKEKWAALRIRFLDRRAVVGSVTVVAREMGLNCNSVYVWGRQAGLTSKRPPHAKKAEPLALRKAGEVVAQRMNGRPR
ncbi:hypothetical protein GCM10025768_27580 [Microbacterium pseudoresistens]